MEIPIQYGAETRRGFLQMRYRNLISVVFSFGSLVALATPARAHEIMYSYTGNDFMTASSPYSTSDFLQFDIVLANALAPSLTQTIDPSSILSAFFSDGVDTTTTLFNTTTSVFEFTTDATGAIMNWQVKAFFNPTSLHLVSCDLGTETTSLSQCQLNEIQDSVATNVAVFARNVSAQGVWTATAVPEPSSGSLMLFVALVLLFVRVFHQALGARFSSSLVNHHSLRPLQHEPPTNATK